MTQPLPRSNTNARLALALPPLFEVERLGNMVVASTAMRAVVARVKKLARASAPVLVSGPSGTGKELVARALHDESSRKGGPFVAINCGALTATVIESELFGHTRGAFTGAVADKEGAFGAASGGTLFLDEIGELPLELQPKLLRALESMSVRRVGSNTEEPVDVRVVAATHRDLAVLVEEGLFREDLYHRLVVLSVELPPLGERTDDILLLARHFLAQETHGERRLGPSAERALAEHDWPGNVRELRNVITRVVALTEAPVIEAEDLELLPARRSSARPRCVAPVPQRAPGVSLREELEALERARMEAALAEHPSQVEAAKALGVPIRTFLNRLDALRIPRPRKAR